MLRTWNINALSEGCQKKAPIPPLCKQLPWDNNNGGPTQCWYIFKSWFDWEGEVQLKFIYTLHIFKVAICFETCISYLTFVYQWEIDCRNKLFTIIKLADVWLELSYELPLQQCTVFTITQPLKCSQNRKYKGASRTEESTYLRTLSMNEWFSVSPRIARYRAAGTAKLGTEIQINHFHFYLPHKYFYSFAKTILRGWLFEQQKSFSSVGEKHPATA